MNFELTNAQKDFTKAVSECFSGMETGGLTNMENLDAEALEKETRRWYARMGEAGFFEKDAESEAVGYVGRCAAMMETASHSLSLGMALQTTRMFASMLEKFGSDAMRELWLDKLHRGEVIAALALYDDEEQPVRAEKTEAGYVLSGKKPFAVNAPHADVFLVSALLDDKPAAFLMTPDDAGFSRSGRIATMGLRGLSLGGITLENAALDENRRFPGYDAEIFAMLASLYDLGLSAAGAGACRQAVRLAKAHAESRRRGGKPVGKQQEVRFRLAEMFTLMQTAEWLVYRAAWMAQTRDSEAWTMIQAAKVFASENLEIVASGAMQIMAGKGFLSGSGAESLYRDAKALGIVGTSSENGRMRIADDLLERYGE